MMASKCGNLATILKSLKKLNEILIEIGEDRQ